MLNATLAGGVAIGTASDMISTPWMAILIGYCGGLWSAVGFQKIGPYIMDTFNVHDTCGVNSLHGMPGIMGGIVSMIALLDIDDRGFPKDYWAAGSASA